MQGRSVVVILGLCAALVSATQPSASLQPVDGDTEDAEFGGGAVRALLELHESAQANDAFQEHIDTLLLSLREQAHAHAAGDSADAAEVAAAADVADAEAADEAESDAAAEGEPSVRVFGEAPAVAPITATAEAAEGTLRDEEWGAGPALLEADSDADADADSDSEADDEVDAAEANAEMAAAADVADAEDAEGEDVRVFGEAPTATPITATAEAAEGTLAEEEWSAGPALLELDGADADADAESDSDSDSDSDEEADAEEDADEESAHSAESDASEDGMPVEMEAAAMERSEIVEAIPSTESLADEQWTEGAALLELDTEEEEQDEEDEEDSDSDSSDEADAAFVQVQVQGDWKDPPVWWKAPEEEMANADQQPWPLDPNFPMSVLDPPPNLPLANIEDANNYPPMADPQMAFNIDPSAFPQTNDKVGTDDPSFASFSINGR